MSQGLTSLSAKKTSCQLSNTVSDSCIVHELRYHFRHKNTVIHREKEKHSLHCLKNLSSKSRGIIKYLN